MERYDIAIVGAGPAGLSAAITAKIRNKNIVLLGNGSTSQKVEKAEKIQNYLGLPDISGDQMAQAFMEHLKQMDISIQPKKAAMIYSMGDHFSIQAGDELIESSTVILATGVSFDKTFPGEETFLGRGVSYCATCDAPLYRDKTVAVIGYGTESEREAEFLAESAKKVLYFPMYDMENSLSETIEIIHQKPVEIIGSLKADTVRCQEQDYSVDGIFVLRESIAPAHLVPGLQMEGNHVAVNLQMETNLPGCFACGDLAGRPYQYIKSAGQGNIAALSAVAYLDTKVRQRA